MNEVSAITIDLATTLLLTIQCDTYLIMFVCTHDLPLHVVYVYLQLMHTYICMYSMYIQYSWYM